LAGGNDRITDELWYFRTECLKLNPGNSTDGGVAPGDPKQKGYHNYRDKLHALGYGPNEDYSIRYNADLGGPGDCYAAFDWVFNDAKNGRYNTIMMFMSRLRAALDSNDPRLYGFREALGQQDSDANPEGLDFLLRNMRTPDMTHMWHIHFSVLRRYLRDLKAMQAMLSILAGETLATWLSGRSRYGGSTTMGMDYEGWDTPKHVGGRPRDLMLAEVWSILQAGESAYGGQGWLNTTLKAIQEAMAQSAKREDTMQASLAALVKLMSAGGGSADSAAIISALRTAIEEASAREGAIVQGLQGEISLLRKKLSDAAQAEADKLK
jgi:hypothetical protein